ncbi:MAG TPA: DUF6259 domain-containing protein [Thermoguttaceae bacterium]|nr:DUF6259 domain-containing protein [Thermoguttaceae bacterium]
MQHSTGLRLTLAFPLLVAACPASAAEPIDGRSVARWAAQPDWSPGQAATDCGARDRDGWLEFSVAGRDRVMTWTRELAPEELGHEPRYLVFRYRASELSSVPGSYLLVAWDGSPHTRHFLGRDRLVADGREHVLVVDVLSYAPPSPIERLAIRIGPAPSDRGRLLVKMEFTDEVPEGVEPIRQAPREPEKVRIEVEDFPWQPSPHWTPRPPDDHGIEPTEGAVRFQMTGQQKSMRWSAKPPDGLDLARMPYVSVRYRARGKFGPYGYAFYLGVLDAEGKRTSTYAMEPGDVDGDGRWHVFHKKLDERGVGSSMAVGIDSLSPAAEIEIDYVEYSSLPPRTPIEEILAFEPREAAWPNGKDGLVTVTLPDRAAPPNHFMIPRMGIGSWFPAAHVTVEGIPFEVATDPSAIFASGTVSEDKLAVDLPPDAREVLLLLAAAFPSSEPFGADWRRPTPLRMLAEPERMTIELVYADGTSDHVLPIHAAKGEYGVGHDVALYAVPPSPGKSPNRLILHDNMPSASFGLLGVTANTGEPRVPKPELHEIWYPEVEKPPLSDATIAFGAADGLTWDTIRSPMLQGAVELAGRPVFSLTIDDRELPSSQWNVEEVEKRGDVLRAVATYSDEDVSLRAQFEARKTDRNAAVLSLGLLNTGKTPVTAALFFPCVSGLRIGSVDDTWYFCARRGGVINRVPCFWRDEIGESHPLQVDGFFNPVIGAGICFMPRDLEGVFRWHRVEKDETGGAYSLEFLPQMVPPGETWESVPVQVAVVPGDWKDQFHVYRSWVKTWYEPMVPRKPWFARVFAFPSYSPTSPMSRPIDERLDLVGKSREIREALGACDYMHLFAWAKSEEYGHWGDYDHYHQLGGKERFVEAVRRCREQEVPVGLYLDGYLVSTKSQKPSNDQRKQWAVRQQDGRMLYHDDYDAHSMCPYVPAWRDYLAAAYRRVAHEIRPSGMYLDELGKCMTHRTCYAEDHGHRTPMGTSPGEWVLTRQIREAVPPEIATYCEYVPADVACQYLDGAFGHVPLYGHRSGYDEVAPHYVNLQRFALPDFKTFELIYSVPLENGNWYLLKYPFFNGDGYYLKGTCLLTDEHSRAFYRRAFRVQHAHADAFTSTDVEPLVRTEVPNLFANRFSTQKKTVWTLLNANYRTLRGKLMAVEHRDGAQYFDCWNERPVDATAVGDRAELRFEIGPRSIGCIVQQ